MSRWTDRLRFLWEEETSPREEAPGRARDEPAGVPRPLRLAARFALIAVAATSLMTQVVGVRMVAPVDAAPSYRAQCEKACDQTSEQCESNCESTYQNCQNQAGQQLSTCQTSCNSLQGKARDNCVKSCNQTYGSQFKACQQNKKTCSSTCKQNQKQCRQNCQNST